MLNSKYSRHRPLSNILIALVATITTIAPMTGFAQQDVTTVQVTDSIYMISGKGGNIGVFIGADGTFMIDDKYAPMSEGISAAIESLGGDQPKFLLNTHYHGDHTGGNENFGSAGATIVSHDNVHALLASGSTIKAFNMETPPAPGTALPAITFSSEITFHINDEAVQIFHTPNAHTNGDSVVFFPNSKTIHTGDVFFNGFYPFIDVEHGGTVTGVIAAADKILKLANDQTKIIPGHGPLAGVKDLAAYRDMLNTVRERLSELKSAGMSAEDAAAQSPLSDLEAQWGDGFLSSAQWINIIYEGL